MHCALFLILSAFIIFSCAGELTHNIYPGTTCQNHSECLTLSDVLMDMDKYFASHSTLVFHDGEHILQGEVVSVSNISNFTLQGYSGSGRSSTAITCINSHDFTRQDYNGSRTGSGLKLNGSGSGLPIPHVSSVLSFSDVSITINSIEFNHCSVSLSHATAVVHNSTFGNGGAVDGGALVVMYSNVQFDGASSFSGNVAERYGGALFADWSNLTFSGNTAFTENKAQTGGAVYCWNRSSLNFSGNISFMRNTAEWSGGAVSAENNNTLSFNGNIRLMSNTAEVIAGGAVYAKANNTLSFNGKSHFIGNTAVSNGTGLDLNSVLLYNYELFNTWLAGYFSYGGYGGAVFVYDENTLCFSGSSSFINNTSNYHGNGGAVTAWYTNMLSFNGSSTFMSNAAEYGGAVFVLISNTLRLNGNSTFISNAAKLNGGAVSAGSWNTLSFNGNNRFMSNTAKQGGGVRVQNSNNIVFNGTSTFIRNTAAESGGAEYVGYRNSLSFNGCSSFMENTADHYGGAVYSLSSILSLNGRSSFKSNMADVDGGAVCVKNGSLSFHGSSIFKNNEAARGGGIALFLNSYLHLSGPTILSLNTASLGGGVFTQDSGIDFIENIVFTENKGIHGGGLFVQSSDVTFQGTGILARNTVTNLKGGYGGAIFAINSIVEFQGSFDVTNNMAEFGGGLAFFGVHDGVLIIKNRTVLKFEGNVAQRRGGAIYVEDDPFTFCAFDNATQNHVDEACFFQIRDRPYNCFDLSGVAFDDFPQPLISLKFDSNTANVSGDIMYGGHLNACVICKADYYYKEYYFASGAEVFRRYAESKMDVFAKLSSDPYKVCICEDSNLSCDTREVNRTVYPGQVLVTSVVAVGQMNGMVPSVIRAVSDDLIDASRFQETQPAEKSRQCSQLQYPLFSSMPSTSLKLYSDEPCSTSGYPLTFLISFLPCPVGFTLSEQGGCICDGRLQKYTQNCTIESLTVSRDASDSFWVGVDGTDELILHPHCPFDYCTETTVHFPLNNTDIQCAKGRSGILCGACQPGHGLALGSSQCLSDCSNAFITLLLVFASSGVALVAFLFLCHITVAAGTLSGLIFYANIVAVNQTVFFPSGERNLLTVFIAWLNLDLGIETCFFVSLDTYYSTWLQFAFPIYIWVMVGVIIVFADRSVGFAKIIGSTNPVAVLATLFLLSYTKLLRAIMAAFSFTILDYPDGNSKYVWLYDGNIGYLDRNDGRHIALFLFSFLFLLLIFFPYNLLLLCGQWIQKHLWWLSSTKQLYLKFFLDAHYGPYKNRHRYWTGLLLLLRFFMLFVTTITNINNPQDPYSNLLVILVVMSSLFMLGWIVQGFYKKWYQDLLEASFIFNLLVLAGGTYQVRQSGGNQAALVYTSVGIAFVTFIGIVLSAVVRRVREKVAEHRRRTIHQLANTVPDDEEDSVQLVPAATHASAVTYSVLEIVRHNPEQTSGEIQLRPATPT